MATDKECRGCGEIKPVSRNGYCHVCCRKLSAMEAAGYLTPAPVTRVPPVFNDSRSRSEPALDQVKHGPIEDDYGEEARP